MMLLTRMLSERPGLPGLRQQMPRTIDLHPGLARLVHHVDDVGIDQRVQLGPDLRRAAGGGVVDFLFDVLHQTRLEIDRRDGDALKLFGRGVARDVVEDARRVPAQRRIAGEVRQVGVDPGRRRTVP